MIAENFRNLIREDFYKVGKQSLDKVKSKPTSHRKLTKLVLKILYFFTNLLYHTWWYITSFPDVRIRVIKYDIEVKYLEKLKEKVLQILHPDHHEEFNNVIDPVIRDMLAANWSIKSGGLNRQQHALINQYFRYYCDHRPTLQSVTQHFSAHLKEQIQALGQKHPTKKMKNLIAQVEKFTSLMQISFQHIICKMAAVKI